MFHILQIAILAVFPALVISAALRDAVSYTIPNWISLALIAGFALAAPVAALPLGALGVHLSIGAIALVMGMVMFALGWIGGGDAKLFAAAALWMGWPTAPVYLVFTGVAGGGLAVALLALRSSRLRPLIATGPAWIVRLSEPGENVPYGVAIAIGALATFPTSTLVKLVAPV